MRSAADFNLYCAVPDRGAFRAQVSATRSCAVAGLDLLPANLFLSLAAVKVISRKQYSVAQGRSQELISATW